MAFRATPFALVMVASDGLRSRVRVIYLSPGAVLPDHTHSDEEELKGNIGGSDVSGGVPRTTVLRLDGVRGGVTS